MFAFFVVILIALIYMLSLGKPVETMRARPAKVKFNNTTAVRIFDNDNIIQNTTAFLNDSVA